MTGVAVHHGKAEELAADVPDGSFDLVVTDPPYGLPVRTSVKFRDEKATQDWVLGDRDQDENLARYDWLFHESKRLLHPNGYLYAMLADWMIPLVAPLAEAAGWNVRYVFWGKPSVRPAFPGVPWAVAVECALFCYRKHRSGVRFKGPHSSLWVGQPPGGKSRVHPTQKPVGLFQHWLSRTPGRVLDPFCGAGSVLIAAQRLGLEAVGFEKELQFVEAARQRLELDQVEPLV